MKKIAYLGLIILSISMISCNKNSQSLQGYIVESKEKSYFQSLDISSSLIEGYLSKTDNETNDIIKSVQKVNLLGMVSIDNKEVYELEKQKINHILKKSKEYKSLITVKKSGIKLSFYYKGNPDNISEVIVFGYQSDKGLGLARIIGDNIKTEKLISLVNKADIPDEVFDGLSK